jgi:hypothetical protein
VVKVMINDAFASVTAALTQLLIASKRHKGFKEWSLMNKAVDR